MDSPELTQKFVQLASRDNQTIGLYYRNVVLPILLRYIRPDDRLIDLGCAGGVLLCLLRERGFRHLWGMDAAASLLDRIPDPTIHRVCDNYLRIRDHFGAGSFDAVTVFNTLHHLDSREEYTAFFTNLADVIRPGGRVIVKELRNGIFYRIYNGIIFNSVTRTLFPGTFGPRCFVQTEEREMHARFFREFVPHLRSIVSAGGRFRILARHLPLTFEQMIVLERV
ncbi:MAG TPA: class I SAM-dependent methyltransferase [Candidatus Ozemobacteraceae bacterium]|nr:class I SAM-dependent methyltransferase [Candidatus Ozemobacteraceae bacterium]